MKCHNIIILIFVTLFIMIVIGSCDCGPGPEPPPPDTLEGNYRGWYTYIDDSTNDTLTQTIWWYFSSSEYEMMIDEDAPDYSDFCLCETSGLYLLEDQLRFAEENYNTFNSLCIECDAAKNPTGQFLLDRSTDTLVMTQQLTIEDVTIVKKIRLIKLGDI